MTTVADHVANNAISGATWNFTVSSTTAGDLGTVEIGCQSLGTQYTGITVTDNATGGSSTWTQRLVNLTGAGGRSIYVAHCLSLKAGATSVTATLTGGASGASGISAYQRFTGSGTWSTDQSGSTSSTAAGATATITASAVNVGTTDAVIAIGVLGNGDPTEGLSDPPTGSTWFSGAVSQNDSTSTSAEICYRVNTSAVTDSATWTSNAGGIVANCPTVIVSYQLTAAITGTAAITEGADTAAGAGSASTSGTAAITEGHDTASASGSASSSGTAAITEGHDNIAASGTLSVSGTAAILEAVDTVSASGTASAAGSAAITEGHDTVAASGASGISGTAAITEARDSVAASGTVSGGIVPAGRHRKRYPVRDGDRSLIFDNKADAQRAERSKQPDVPILAAPAPLRIKIRPTVIAQPEFRPATPRALPHFDHSTQLRAHDDEMIARALLAHERSHLPLIAQGLSHVLAHLQRVHTARRRSSASPIQRSAS